MRYMIATLASFPAAAAAAEAGTRPPEPTSTYQHWVVFSSCAHASSQGCERPRNGIVAPIPWNGEGELEFEMLTLAAHSLAGAGFVTPRAGGVVDPTGGGRVRVVTQRLPALKQGVERDGKAEVAVETCRSSRGSSRWRWHIWQKRSRWGAERWRQSR